MTDEQTTMKPIITNLKKKYIFMNILKKIYVINACWFFKEMALTKNVKDIHIEEQRNDSPDKKPMTSLKLRIKYNILNMFRNLYLNQLLTMIFFVNTKTPPRVKNKIVLFVKRNSSQIVT